MVDTLTPEAKKPRKQPLQVLLDPPLKQGLEQLSQATGLPQGEIIRRWVAPVGLNNRQLRLETALERKQQPL